MRDFLPTLYLTDRKEWSAVVINHSQSNSNERPPKLAFLEWNLEMAPKRNENLLRQPYRSNTLNLFWPFPIIWHWSFKSEILPRIHPPPQKKENYALLLSPVRPQLNVITYWSLSAKCRHQSLRMLRICILKYRLSPRWRAVLSVGRLTPVVTEAGS